MSEAIERIEATSIPDSVMWSEGMQLGPQHFQLSNRRLEQLAAYLVAAALPYRWGVIDLFVPPTPLSQKVFEVERFEGVMPDGLVISYPMEDSLPLSLDLAPHIETLRDEPCIVHLAVLAQRPGLRVDPDTNVGRYAQRVQKSVPDDFAPDGRVDVACLRPALTLVLTRQSERPPLKFTTIPLARILLDDSRIVIGDFVPPRLSVDRRSALHPLIGKAVERVREKAETRASYLKSQSVESVGLDATQLRALVAPLPKLEAMIQSGASHPFDVYLALCDAFGTLACLTALDVPTKLPAYDHADPLPCFTDLIRELDRLIDQLSERFDKFPFENLGDGNFRLVLKAPWLQEHLYVQLMAGASQPLWQVEQWARRALIGDRDRMAQIREARALGAPRSLIEREEKIELVRASDAVLLRIPLRTPSQPSGLQLGEHKTLEIQSEIPSDSTGRPKSVVLYVPKPADKPARKP